MLGNYCETRYKNFEKELDDPKNLEEERKRLQTTYQGNFRTAQRGSRAPVNAPQLFPNNPHYSRMINNCRVSIQNKHDTSVDHETEHSSQPVDLTNKYYAACSNPTFQNSPPRSTKLRQEYLEHC